MRRALAALLLATAGVACAADTAVIIDSSRQLMPNSMPRNAAWLGLFCQKLDCELRPVAVDISIDTAKDIMDSEVELDSVFIDGKPRAVFANLPLKPGKVVTWHAMNDAQYFGSPQFEKLRKLGKWNMPWGPQPLTLSWVKTAEERKRYHLTDGTIKQFLFAVSATGEYGGETTPVVYWAGDMDGDGKLDLLLGIPDESCAYDERLYLSSGAAEGTLLRKVAHTHGSQPACGC
ncbi:FG-GAP repeat protein [Pseudoduganella sp. HUAS MS19]